MQLLGAKIVSEYMQHPQRGVVQNLFIYIYYEKMVNYHAKKCGKSQGQAHFSLTSIIIFFEKCKTILYMASYDRQNN